ncbi:hypothetical protein SGRA_2494 [Saprospira grandis str. Lewin]|uniref:Uncharacterized protein n=1 Tax=Saprospira grandis (strain Lewin) TaxID=984262 RepID=H6L5K6_SAPGL|nr:hypothetical protein SGRA_2494 [Saprospira grandis str. Lewin]
MNKGESRGSKEPWLFLFGIAWPSLKKGLNLKPKQVNKIS